MKADSTPISDYLKLVETDNPLSTIDNGLSFLNELTDSISDKSFTTPVELCQSIEQLRDERTGDPDCYVGKVRCTVFTLPEEDCPAGYVRVDPYYDYSVTPPRYVTNRCELIRGSNEMCMEACDEPLTSDDTVDYTETDICDVPVVTECENLVCQCIDSVCDIIDRTCCNLDQMVNVCVDHSVVCLDNTINTLSCRDNGHHNHPPPPVINLSCPPPTVICGKDTDSKIGDITVCDEIKIKVGEGDGPDDAGLCEAGGDSSGSSSEMFAYLSGVVQQTFADVLAASRNGGLEPQSKSPEASHSPKGRNGFVASDLFGRVPNWRSKEVCDYLATCTVDRSDCRKWIVTKWFWNVQVSGADKNRCLFLRPKWFVDLFNSIPLIGEPLGELIYQIGWRVTKTIDELLHGVSRLANCDFGVISKPLVIKVIAGVVEKWTGLKVPKLDSLLTKWIDFTCPENMPSTAEAENAYLASTITKEQMLCIARANNDIPEHIMEMVYAQRNRLTNNDNVQLWLRGIYNDDELRDSNRENGVLNPNDTAFWKELAFQTPQVSDLIPFMVRDVFDEQVVKDYKLDAEFTRKYTDKAKELFRSAGIKDEHAKLHWRSHWSFPSNTQLYEMFHRLRGGQENTEFYQYFDDDGNELKPPKRLTKDDIKVTEKDLQQVLAINDIAPYWRPRLAAISRPPLTRVDIRRAYEIDAITENQVYESYRDIGYSEVDAKTLTDFSRKLKERSRVQKEGRIRPPKVASLYRTSAITEDEATKLLLQAGLTSEQALATIVQAKIERNAIARNKCIRSIRKRYLTADIDEADVVKQLQALGVDDVQALALRDELRCDLSYRSKEVTAAMLCTWFDGGLIEEDNYRKRLIRLGYHKDDADKIIKSCQVKVSKKKGGKAK